MLLIFILPAYIANSTPVIFGGGTPMDFGRKAWDRKRCLGDGKTWRGFIAGIAMGTLAGAAIAGLLGNNFYVWLGFLLSFGALAGDASNPLGHADSEIDDGALRQFVTGPRGNQPTLVQRQGFIVKTSSIGSDGRCPGCHAVIPGRWPTSGKPPS